jgi:hypothetical protein
MSLIKKSEDLSLKALTQHLVCFIYDDECHRGEGEGSFSLKVGDSARSANEDVNSKGKGSPLFGFVDASCEVFHSKRLSLSDFNRVFLINFLVSDSI